MLAFPMLEATKWRLQPLLAAINLKPPALPGDTYLVADFGFSFRKFNIDTYASWYSG